MPDPCSLPADPGSVPRPARVALLRQRLNGPLLPVLLAAVLGLIGIGDKSLWLDEAFSAAIARLPTAEIPPYLWRNELHGAPYYLVLHFWSVLGTSELQLRLLSVIFAVVAVGATFHVGRRYGVGLPAALVLAASALLIEYEHNARAYTLLAAWSALSTLAFLRMQEQPTRLRVVVYIGLAAAMLYVHPTGGFVILAHAVWLVISAPAGTSRVRPLALFVPVVLAWLPMVRFMALHRDKISWIPALSLQTLADNASVFAGGGLALGALAVLLALGLRRDVVALWLILPVVGIIAISILIQPTLQARYLTAVLPAAAIIIARNRPALVAIFLGLSLLGAGSWYLSPAREDWRAATAWLRAYALPSDGVVFVPTYARLPLDYYGEVGRPLYPPIPWDGLYMPGLGSRTVIEFDDERVWLIETHGPQAPAEVKAALAAYYPLQAQTFGANGPVVTLLLRRDPP